MRKTAALPGIFFRELTGSCQVARGSRIICAVSGGPDSMALLYLLAAAREHLDLALTAVWVDHGLRPEETPTEERTVMLAAEQLQITCIRHRVDAAFSADQRGISLEHAARDLRYAALRATTCEVGAEYIAVAHTADDQAEEILLRLLRGSGREGVAGMRMRSRDLIRPLLNIEKKDLLAWLTEQEIPFCFDSSNDDMRFLRNRVRHQLLPFLEEHFEPGVKKSLRKTADSLSADEELLAALTAEAEEKTISSPPSELENPEESLKLRLDRASFRTLHPALQRRVVERLLWRVGGRAGYDHILLVIRAAESGRTNSELHLGKGLRVGVFRDRLEFSYPAGRKAWRGRLFGENKMKCSEEKMMGENKITEKQHDTSGSNKQQVEGVLLFNDCTLPQLDSMFGLEQIRPCALLDEWLNTRSDISEFERQVLCLLREKLIVGADDWNEVELAYNFIGPIMSFVNFTGRRCNFFAERPFSGAVEGITMRGRPDGMIASGVRVPGEPYFCFQEYKKEKNPEGDPAAQVLAAMLTAQEINGHRHPVYGCYVKGRDWFFLILYKKEYAVSEPYIATREDVFDIFRILKSLRRIVFSLAGEDTMCS